MAIKITILLLFLMKHLGAFLLGILPFSINLLYFFSAASKARKCYFGEGLKGRIVFQIAGKMESLVRAESMISL